MLTSGIESRRRGTSLVDLLVALALFGVIGAATLRSLNQQARFHTGIFTILESRAQHAAAHEAVATELRSVSSGAGDINRLTDSAIVFRLPVASAVLCRLSTGVLDFAPDSVAAGQTLANNRTAPQPGDTAWVLDEGVTDMPGDDTWVGLPVSAAAQGADRCIGTPFVDSIGDAGRLSWRLAVARDPPPTVTAGAPVRLTRLARFALYRSGTGEYALGYSDVNPATGTWVAIQPVSGPYTPYNSPMPSASGFALAGVDSSGSGTIVPGPGTPAAITIATRTRTTRVVRGNGVAGGSHADSLRSFIALRNRR